MKTKCRLCSTYNFNNANIQDIYGNMRIALHAGSVDSRIGYDDDSRFRYCPLCGRKLEPEDFEDKEIA